MFDLGGNTTIQTSDELELRLHLILHSIARRRIEECQERELWPEDPLAMPTEHTNIVSSHRNRQSLDYMEESQYLRETVNCLPRKALRSPQSKCRYRHVLGFRGHVTGWDIINRGDALDWGDISEPRELFLTLQRVCHVTNGLLKPTS